MRKLHSCIQKNTSAKACVDMALYDLYGKRYGAPLYQLLGGDRKELETDLTISVNPVDEMVRDSVAAVKRGYRILKTKVGKEGLKDIERIAAIREAVGGDVKIRVDANQGWTAKQAVHAMRTLEDAGVVLELLEQPVKAADISGLKYVTDRVNTPVMADESVFSPSQVMDLIQQRAADIINIKLMKTGGLSNAIRIADIAGIYGVPCMIGCMIESSISVAAAVHLAVAKSDVITKVDLDGPSLGQFDPVSGGVHFNESEISISDVPGLGITEVRGLEMLG